MASPIVHLRASPPPHRHSPSSLRRNGRRVSCCSPDRGSRSQSFLKGTITREMARPLRFVPSTSYNSAATARFLSYHIRPRALCPGRPLSFSPTSRSRYTSFSLIDTLSLIHHASRPSQLDDTRSAQSRKLDKEKLVVRRHHHNRRGGQSTPRSNHFPFTTPAHPYHSLPAQVAGVKASGRDYRIFTSETASCGGTLFRQY